jgi:enoyl-CoA hydratase/carnithine racemase
MAEATPPLLAIEGAVATIRLNRPGQGNRLEPEDLDALEAHCAAIDGNESVRVLVLASAGKTFCGGYHLGAIAAAANPAPHHFEQVTDRLEELRVPSIAALQGSLYGGAGDLALACDFRIGVHQMELAVPPAKLGIHYYASGLRRYVNRLGPAAAKRILLAGTALDSEELLRIGFLDEVTSADRLGRRVAEFAAELAARAPLAVEGMKRFINEIARGEFDRAAIGREVARCLASEDCREGLAAFRGRRPPTFRRS